MTDQVINRKINYVMVPNALFLYSLQTGAKCVPEIAILGVGYNDILLEMNKPVLVSVSKQILCTQYESLKLQRLFLPFWKDFIMKDSKCHG